MVPIIQEYIIMRGMLEVNQFHDLNEITFRDKISIEAEYFP